MSNFIELVALLSALADPERQLLAGYTVEELADLDELLALVRERIVEERAIRKDGPACHA